MYLQRPFYALAIIRNPRKAKKINISPERIGKIVDDNSQCKFVSITLPNVLVRSTERTGQTGGSNTKALPKPLKEVKRAVELSEVIKLVFASAKVAALGVVWSSKSPVSEFRQLR
jgi:hypothetical protein